MSLPLKAKVKDGRLLLDEPTELPDGTIVELFPLSDDEELDEEERQKLDDFLEKSMKSAQQGKLVTHEELNQRLAKLLGAFGFSSRVGHQVEMGESALTSREKTSN